MNGSELPWIVRTHGLSKRYGELEALKGVDLTIPPGSVGLLGPNGAGKSTLIKCLLGLLDLTDGSFNILGYDSTTREGKVLSRQRIGYVPEDDCLINSMNALSFVKFMGEVSGLPPGDSMQRAHEVLHYVGIGDERYRPVGTYSTGMKQKVKLAQALVHDPELLILDEPTNGMDPKGRQEMLDLILDISSSHGKNILFSSHLLPDVEHVCESVIILDEGRIVEQGNISELKGESAFYEIRIKGDQDLFFGILKDMGLDAVRTGSLFKVPYREGLLDSLFREVRGKGIQIRHARRFTLTLEDLFVRNIKRGEVR
ncbi:MAG TPA: ABC transporter ATP-binding protein [Euryarchaeota archaeon]|nr:ABC transporter ATP-binding protein [Euryarchaeota archaeon]